jgi:hypothetical protein
MIYTCNFANIRNIAGHVIPVAICQGIPEWYTGASYKKFAPSWELVNKWKNDIRNDDYFGVKRRQYNSEVLDGLNVQQVVDELQALIPEEIRQKMKEPIWENRRYHLVLLCYERSGDFCHRHFVAQWFTQNGYPCEEVYIRR